MRKILPIFFFLLASCNAGQPNITRLSYTAPVKFGDFWSKKKNEMGAPDKSGENFYSYFSKGMVVYLSPDGSTVTSLVFTWFAGGQHFTGEVYGIKIADTYPKVVRLWGEPASSGLANEDFYEKKWVFKKFGISVQFWAKPGDDENLGGHYETDTVKRIQIMAV